jgi:hypothetical protein
MSDLYQRNVFARAEWLRDNYLKSQFKGVQDVEFENFDLEDLRTRVIREEDDLRSEGGGSDDSDSGFGSNHQELKLDLSGLNDPKEKDQQI